jgi:hypothetical protein
MPSIVKAIHVTATHAKHRQGIACHRDSCQATSRQCISPRFMPSNLKAPHGMSEYHACVLGQLPAASLSLPAFQNTNLNLRTNYVSPSTISFSVSSKHKQETATVQQTPKVNLG